MRVSGRCRFNVVRGTPGIVCIKDIAPKRCKVRAVNFSDGAQWLLSGAGIVAVGSNNERMALGQPPSPSNSYATTKTALCA